MITIEDIEAYTLQEVAANFRPSVQEWIEQMTTYIERATNREFVTGDSTSTRKYDGSGTSIQLVDDYSALTSVVVDGSTIDVTEYPTNSTPKYKLMRNGRFPRGLQNVEVMAVWGYGEVPADIRFACTVLVAGMVQNHTNSDGAKASESIGNYSVSYATEVQRNDFNRVKDILANYRIHHL